MSVALTTANFWYCCLRAYPFLGRNNRRFVEIRKIFIKKISILALSCYYFVLIAEKLMTRA